MKKKIISLFLCITLITSMFAGAAFVNHTKVNAEENEFIKVSVIKVWDDYNDFDGLRPGEIKVTLYRLDEYSEIATVTLSEKNNWFYEYDTLLPKYENGSEIPYGWECSDIVEYDRYIDELDNMTIITDCHDIAEQHRDVVTLQNLDENENYLDQCRLRVVNSDNEELIQWISGDEGSISVKDNSLKAELDKNGSLVVNGLPDGVYDYEVVKPKAGYTAAKSRKFKIENQLHDYSYNWYTSLEQAVADANNLTTENADCYRNHIYKDDGTVTAGVFIFGNTAKIIMVDNGGLYKPTDLLNDTVIDLNEHFITFQNDANIRYGKNLKIVGGKLDFTNNDVMPAVYSTLTTGEVTTGDLTIENVELNHKSTKSGSATVVSASPEVNIINSKITSSFESSGYSIYDASSESVLNVENSTINTATKSSSAVYNVYTRAGEVNLTENHLTVSGTGIAYNTYSSGSNVHVKSGEFNTNSSGGNAINIYATKSRLTVDDMKGYAKSTGSTGWTQGIYIGGDKAEAVINNCYIETMGTKYNNVALYIGAGADVKVYGGYLYSLPVPNGKQNDAYGAAVVNNATCLFEERGDKLVVSGGNCGVQCSQGTTTVFNSGTFKSPNHGGAYITSGSKGHCEINGGEFINDYKDYDESVVGDYNNGGIHNFAALYVGFQTVSPYTSGEWSVNIKNAKIYGGATWGLAVKADGSFIPASVNLYNTFVEGAKADIWIPNFDNINKYNAFVNLYDGTTLGHNIVYDQYNVHNNEPHVIDYRTDAGEFETIVQ